jgi:carboxyl-terminal processing protease
LVTDGRNFRADQQFIAEDDSLAYGVPMVVIVNQKSASAAEVLAAALQDNNRALLIGSRTYGKGTVQTVIRLPDGGEMTVTWARMFAPSGYALSTFGVYPDLCTIDLADPGGNDRSTIRQAQERAASLLVQRRKSATLSDNDRQTLLQSCAPKEPKNPEIDADLQTAKAILGTPNLALLPAN